MKHLIETNATYARITRNNAVELELPNDATDEEAAEAHRAAKEIYDAWQAGEITTDELAWEHLRLIGEDVADGWVPWDVADFSELHNYVDANCYSLEICGYYYVDDDGENLGDPDLINAVQTRVSELLCGSDVPGYWSFRDDFSWQERRAARHPDPDHTGRNRILTIAEKLGR